MGDLGDLISDKELVRGFCLENFEQFSKWIDLEHDIDPMEAESILDAIEDTGHC
jgi:hypothetical protein